MGWYSVSQRQANQDYTVEVSVVGSDGYKPIARVNYAPFTGNGGNYETQVTLTFELNTASAPAGYVVSAIRTFAGWKAATAGWTVVDMKNDWKFIYPTTK